MEVAGGRPQSKVGEGMAVGLQEVTSGAMGCMDGAGAKARGEVDKTVAGSVVEDEV